MEEEHILGPGSVGVEVDVDTRVVAAVGAGEGDKLVARGLDVSAVDDLNLSTLGVELLSRSVRPEKSRQGRMTYSGHRVQSNSLEADQIVATGGLGWNGRGPAAVLLDHLSSSEETAVEGATEETSMVDLELNGRRDIRHGQGEKIKDREGTYPLSGARVVAIASRAGALGKISELRHNVSSLRW